VSVVVLATFVLPPAINAQQNTSGSVRLVIRADYLPALGLAPDSQAISWMAPSSVEETERLAAMWASGDDDEALRAWRAVLETEVAADRLATDTQVDGAASWIAARAMAIASSEIEGVREQVADRREREIRWAARSAARAFMDGSG